MDQSEQELFSVDICLPRPVFLRYTERERHFSPIEKTFLNMQRKLVVPVLPLDIDGNGHGNLTPEYEELFFIVDKTFS